MRESVIIEDAACLASFYEATLLDNPNNLSMQEEPSIDPELDQLIGRYTKAEVAEIQKYLAEWDAGTYSTVVQSVLDHAERKGFELLRYLRKAHNFNRREAVRIPRTGYRQDSSAVYRKGNEFLIVRPDINGVEKIVTYGVNEE